ncbi:MAG: DUF547 domain-containing protein, partial [Acidobacteria bacterium]|nr:DUF547 domain-containing protein [Acidobacteriota bacterium]
MKHRLSAVLIALALSGTAAFPAEIPERAYRAWDRLLESYYDPELGMDYAGLRRAEKPRLDALRQSLATVEVDALSRDEQLAYWINLYNVNVVGIVVDRYPIRSIRDLSTDLIVRLNVFKKDLVPLAGSMISLDHIEHRIIRKEFRDARIHFAVNCAAASCPPLRKEAYRGARLHEQLDEQVRRFASGDGVRIEQRRGRTVLTTTKIMKWFDEDFEPAGGQASFLFPFLPPAKKALIPREGRVTIEYDDYDWA